MEKTDSTMEAILEEETIKLRLSQLRTESDVFDRIVYKNKNQHRRTPYFRRLLKVRRDLHLLKSMGLEEILKTAYQAICGKRPKQKVYILERLKHTAGYHGKHTFLEKLLGAARLLSQMVEPILKASVEIASLLAMSFFMGFALTVLALLARLRVLLQQILLDVVSIHNMVSLLVKKEQSFQISHEGVKVFRDFYSADKEYLALECAWEGDTFCLIEGSIRSARKSTSEEPSEERESLHGASDIHYETTGMLLGDVEANGENAKVEQAADNQPSFSQNNLYDNSGNGLQSGNTCKIAEKNGNKKPFTRSVPLSNESISEGIVSGATSSANEIMGPDTDTRQKVAFVKIRSIQSSSKFKKSSVDTNELLGGVQVKKQVPRQGKSADDIEGSKPKKARRDDKVFDANESRSPEESEDHFFNLLPAGSTKNSLF